MTFSVVIINQNWVLMLQTTVVKGNNMHVLSQLFYCMIVPNLMKIG